MYELKKSVHKVDVREVLKDSSAQHCCSLWKAYLKPKADKASSNHGQPGDKRKVC